ETCDACRLEVESLRRVWDGLEMLADEAPPATVGDRFYAMLDGYRQAAESEPRFDGWLSRLGLSRPGLSRPGRWWASWWPQQPVRQLAWTLAAVAAGLVVGTRLTAPSADGEMARLHDEVASLTRVVGLSLLEQGSASDRLRGVSYSRRGAAADPRILEVLVGVVENDPDVNVRLAALDVLAGFADRESVLDGLRRSLPRQRAPLAQLALIEVLLAADGPESRATVRRWLAEGTVDETVRAYAENRLGQEV
ncbi:MAG: hypothetical protein V3T72_19700, partial [Thermoanaerobaculia bacterium]